MSLKPASRLGPYEVVAPLAAGGMGEVYRARDPRLGREVALKVLPAEVAEDAERRRRFEQEARAASALNHPNIVTVYDVGSADGVLFVAQELVDGKTVRELLAGGPLAPRRILDLAVQIADGLAKAHEGGIVHRDLKPENLVVSRDGFLKVLDFGLAKVGSASAGDIADLATLAKPDTTPGTVLGTVGYMSPEQAAGRPVDFRSDQFSLGSILYEMASGRRPFRGASSAETLAAIIREDPEPMGRLTPKLPAPLRWTIERCLAKEPDDRYAATRDLARDLRSLRDHLSEASVVPGEIAPPAPRPLRALAILAAAAVLVAGGFALGRRGARPGLPSYEPMTSQRGYISAARFGPDGQIIYSATWEGAPLTTYLKHPTGPDVLTPDLPTGSVLAVSTTGEVAVALDCDRSLAPGLCYGTLARAPLAGGAAREMLESVQQADWAADGSDLAVVRVGAGSVSLEYPMGHVLAETMGNMSFPRLSPKGDLVAFMDHPIRGDDRGFIAVVDRQGRKRRLTQEWPGEQGLAWSSRGEEIWFTAGLQGGRYELRAVTLSGRQRVVATVPGNLRLHDIDRQGRVLLTRDSDRRGILALPPGESREREMSWRDWSVLRDISADGRTLLFDEEGMAAGPNYKVCLRRTDDSQVRILGEGYALRLSPDGKWALSRLPVPLSPLVLLPTGAGEPKRFETGLEISGPDAQFLPSSQGIVFIAVEPSHKRRYYLLDVATGRTRPISPEGVTGGMAISPDGRYVAARGPQGPALFAVDGGDSRPFPGLLEGEEPVRWAGDGNSIYVRSPGKLYPRVFRVAASTGARTLVKELGPADPAGLVVVATRIRMSADGRSYAYGYTRTLSELFVATGLK